MANNGETSFDDIIIEETAVLDSCEVNGTVDVDKLGLEEQKKLLKQ